MLYIKEDIRRIYPYGLLYLCFLKALLSPRYHAVLLYRLMRLSVKLYLMPLAYVFAMLNLLLNRVEIALKTEIGPGLSIPHGNCVIGAWRIGSNFTILQGCTLGSRAGNLTDPQKAVGEDRPILGDNVVMFANSVVVGPVRIGSGCKIGANVFICEDLEDGAVVVAAPFIRKKSRTQPSVAHKNMNQD